MSRPGRKHRSRDFMPLTCPKCGTEYRFAHFDRPAQEFNGFGLGPKPDPVAPQPKRRACPKCGWEDRSESRRGVVPSEYSTGSDKQKKQNHRKKRARRLARRAVERLIKAVVYAAEHGGEYQPQETK